MKVGFCEIFTTHPGWIFSILLGNVRMFFPPSIWGPKIPQKRLDQPAPSESVCDLGNLFLLA